MHQTKTREDGIFETSKLNRNEENLLYNNHVVTVCRWYRNNSLLPLQRLTQTLNPTSKETSFVFLPFPFILLPQSLILLLRLFVFVFYFYSLFFLHQQLHI